MVAASGLLITGLVSSWELVQNLSNGGATGPQPLPSPETTSQTATGQQTVTVTEYVGPSTQATTSQQSSASSQTSTPVPAGYVLVTPLSALAGRTSAYFNHPSRGISLLLNLAGQWKAFSATCTHAPCTVQYTGSSIRCPCHGGIFSPSNGAVQGGPPPAPLPQFGVLIQNDNLYVTA
jgi:Rieske Fe-S protein